MTILASPLRHRIRLDATADSPEDIRGPTVPRGELWRINRIAWEDETDDITRARSFIWRSGYRHWLKEWVAPAGGFLYTDEEEHLLGEGEHVGLRLTGADSADVVFLYISGQILVDSD